MPQELVPERQADPAATALPSAATQTTPQGIVINVESAAQPESPAANPPLGGVVPSLIWPVVALLLAGLFRKEIAALLGGRGARIKSVSFAGFSLELADGGAAPMYAAKTDIDFRSAGTQHDVNDSNLRSFLEQIGSRERMPYAVVDLGGGREWLTSRLFVLAVIMKRMRGMRAVVFVESRDAKPRSFLGVVRAEHIRWRLARWYPHFEAALVLGEQRAWGGPVPPAALQGAQLRQRIDNDEGRFQSPDGAAELLRGFLAALQQNVPPPQQDRENWQELATPGAITFEYSQWLTSDLADRLFGELMQRNAIEQRDLAKLDDAGRMRLLAEHTGEWIAVLRDREFQGLIDREKSLEAIVRASAS